jgi:hypothetical protein
VNNVSSTENYLEKIIQKMQWGKEDGQLGLSITGPMYGLPEDFNLDKEGNIYIVDTNNHRIAKFDKSGKFVFNFGSDYQGLGGYKAAFENVEIDGDGNIYAFNDGPGQIVKFDRAGNPIDVLQEPDWGIGIQMRVNQNGDVYVKRGIKTFKYIKERTGGVFGIFGAKEKYKKTELEFLFESPSGNLYRIKDKNGKGILEKAGKGGQVSTLSAEKADMSESVFNPLRGDRFIGFDGKDNFYITDYNYRKIRKYGPDGDLIVTLDLPQNPGIGPYIYPIVKVDYYGNIYCFLFDKNKAWIIKMERVEQ